MSLNPSKNNVNYITKWTCDVCKVRAFDTFEKAAEHEKTCTGPPPATSRSEKKGEAIDLTNLDDDSSSDGKNAAPSPPPTSSDQHSVPNPLVAAAPPQAASTLTTVWTCDICRSAEFSTFEAADEHEKKCTGKTESAKEQSAAQASLQPRARVDVAKPWLCDRCKVEDFSTFEEAVAHEKICRGKPAGAASKPTPSTSTPEQKRSASRVVQNADISPRAAPSTSSLEQKRPASQVIQNAPLARSPRETPSTSTPEQNSPASQGILDAPLDLSPLVRDENDSPEYNLLTTFHGKLLRSLDLVEIQSESTDGKHQEEHDGRAICLRCHYCQQTLPSPSSFLSLGKIILWDLFNHLTSACKSVPHEHVDLIKVVKSTSEEGKVTLGDFIARFLESNGLKEGRRSLVILPYSKSLVAPGGRRDRWMRSGCPVQASKSSSPKGKASLPVSQPLPVSLTSSTDPALTSATDTALTSTTDPAVTSATDPALTEQLASVVLPLIHKKFEPHSSDLSSFLHLALCQMNLHPNTGYLHFTKLQTPPGVYRLDLKCKHCLASSKVQSLDNFHKAVYSLTYSHLLKSCSRIPNETKESLENFQNKKRGPAGSNVRGGGTGVRQFCQYLADEYHLVDIEGDIDNSVLAGIGIHQSRVPGAMKYAMPRPTESTNKRQADPSDSLLIKTAKRRKKQEDEEIDGFLEQDEDGHQFYIPPPGGVPFISTQSAIMASKLSRYNLLILDQLELFETKDRKQLVRIRCQNCKADPRSVVTSAPTLVRLLHKYVKQISSHVPDCKCLSPHVRQEIGKAQRNKKDKGTVSLNEYCEYLATLYKLEGDTTKGVYFGKGEPIRPGYCGEPGDPLSYEIGHKEPGAVTTVSAVPRHNLMLQAQSSYEVAARKVIPATASKRMILSDCNYLMAAQYKFVLVQRKMPVGLGTERAKRSRSPPSSLPDLAVGLRCQHCDYTRTLLNIRDFSTQSTHFLFTHLQKCPRYADGSKKELNELRDTQSFQKKETVVSTAEYARTLIPNFYGMTDLEWNGVSGGVGFNGDSVMNQLQKLSAKYGSSKHLMQKVDASRDVSWESFAVPLILEDVVESVSSELPSKLAGSSSSQGTSSQLDLAQSASVPQPTPTNTISTQSDLPKQTTEPSKNDAGAQPDQSPYETKDADDSNEMQIDSNPNDAEAKKAVPDDANDKDVVASFEVLRKSIQKSWKGASNEEGGT